MSHSVHVECINRLNICPLRARVCIRVCVVYVCMFVCMYVCLCVCLYVCLCLCCHVLATEFHAWCRLCGPVLVLVLSVDEYFEQPLCVMSGDLVVIPRGHSHDRQCGGAGVVGADCRTGRQLGRPIPVAAVVWLLLFVVVVCLDCPVRITHARRGANV